MPHAWDGAAAHFQPRRPCRLFAGRPVPATKSPSKNGKKAAPVGRRQGRGWGRREARQSPGSSRRAPNGSSAAAQSRAFLEAPDKSSLLNPEALQQKQLHAICSINTQASRDAPESLPAAEAPRGAGRAATEAVPAVPLPAVPWAAAEGNSERCSCSAGQGEGWMHGNRPGAFRDREALLPLALLGGAPRGDDGIADP